MVSTLFVASNNDAILNVEYKQNDMSGLWNTDATRRVCKNL